MKTDNSYIITSAFKKRNSRCPYCVLEAGKVPEEQFWLSIRLFLSYRGFILMK